MARQSQESIAQQQIEMLLNYAEENLFLDSFDRVYVQNQLLDLFNIAAPTDKEVTGYDDIYQILNGLVEFAVKKGICKQEDAALFETKIMGYVTPMPSKVVEMFDNLAYKKGTEAATTMLESLSEKATYIRRPDINKNIYWDYADEEGDITISINLAKPEKTKEDVLRAKAVKGGYPKCILCPECLGFAGNAAYPARQTIRYIPLELNNEQWVMQYSPYVYFKEHIIVLCKEHRPMKITESTLQRLLDFVEQFPHYFLGSNACLPIVGGSVLAHDHYQGGSKVLPMFKCGPRKVFASEKYPDIDISIVDWYNSVIRIEGKNREQVFAFANDVREAWNDYEDKECEIIPFEMENGERVDHNAITPVCSMNSNGKYQFDFILRNNRTDEKRPDGIFHPTPDMHNIKKESIGIIEVMGLFILPGRLSKEMEGIRDILVGKTELNLKELAKETNPLSKHLDMIIQLANDNGTKMKDEDARKVIQNYIEQTCKKILKTTGVFKNDSKGQEHFEKFIKSVL